MKRKWSAALMYATGNFFPVKLSLALLLFQILTAGDVPVDSEKEVIRAFNALKETPRLISFENDLVISNKGGHLQGVQMVTRGSSKYAILSGSSDSYAYAAVVEMGVINRVISLNRLMDKPYKHAGGFQVFENYLAVGIEDNAGKDKSRVCIYDISNPAEPMGKPVAVIQRSGKPMRSTAGCVGITKYKGDALIAVGDWDTKNIDFYSCPYKEIGNVEFKLIGTVATEKMPKEGWTDPLWHSYQNINLINNKDNLFLVGLGQDKTGINIADIFGLQETEKEQFKLTKLDSKSFLCKENSSFKAGAGIVPGNGGLHGIVSCGYNIGSSSFLNYFGITDDKHVVPTLPAHAHNDYVHERPLFDALGQNFKSIEADVFSIGDSLFVAHDFDDIRPGRTLQQLYLDPLKKRIAENNGSVYGNGQEVILFIDIKDNGLKTYKLLDKILSKYHKEVSAFENGKKNQKSILVVVSGNRPFEYMKNQTTRYAGYDGRMVNLDSGISAEIMPVVSDNWTRFFKWNGIGKMPDEEKDKLEDIAARAKKQGYILRFWATPNRTEEQRKAIWEELLNAGVGLIGTDHLEDLNKFLNGKMKQH